MLLTDRIGASTPPPACGGGLGWGLAPTCVATARLRIASLPTSPRARGEAPSPQTRSRRLVASLRAGRPGLVLRHVVLGRRLEQRTHLVLHRRDPVGDLDPLGAVPLLHIGAVMAVVVAARHLVDRRAEPGQP